MERLTPGADIDILRAVFTKPMSPSAVQLLPTVIHLTVFVLVVTLITMASLLRLVVRVITLQLFAPLLATTYPPIAWVVPMPR